MGEGADEPLSMSHTVLNEMEAEQGYAGKLRWAIESLEPSQTCWYFDRNACGCPGYSVLLRVRKASVMPVMSEPRSINDCYAKVSVRRHHAGKPPESEEEIEVLVRIPEQVAKTLAGPHNPIDFDFPCAFPR
jgi:hypothetical protein